MTGTGRSLPDNTDWPDCVGLATSITPSHISTRDITVLFYNELSEVRRKMLNHQHGVITV